jgi:hypothetical protein
MRIQQSIYQVPFVIPMKNFILNDLDKYRHIDIIYIIHIDSCWI